MMNAAERLDWLQQRRVGPDGPRLCATDVVAIMNASRWKTQLSVFNDKLMLVEDNDEDASELMRWGLELEPFLARRYAHRIGVSDSDIVGLNAGVIADPSNLRFAASPDILRVVGKRRGCELKVTGFKEHRGTLHDNGLDYGWGEEGTAEVPDDYSIQCHWCMGIARRLAEANGDEPIQSWDVAVLFAGRDFEVFNIEYNKRVDDVLRAEAQWFLTEHLDANDPPDAVDADAGALSAMFHGDKSLAMLEPADDLAAIANEYCRWHAELKDLTAKTADRKARLKQIIGDASGIKLNTDGVEYLSYFAANPKRKTKTDWQAVARTARQEFGAGGEQGDRAFDSIINTHTKTFDGFGNRSLRVKRSKGETE